MKKNNLTFQYSIPTLKPNEFPNIRKSKKDHLEIRYCKKNNDIKIIGNKQGLLYLAKNIIAMAHAKGENNHIHLMSDFELEKNNEFEVSIENIDLYSEKMKKIRNIPT